MKRFFLLTVLVASLALAACSQLSASGDEIPEPYKTKISQLRADSVAMQRKCADLQKQITEMQAQQNWDQQQMVVTAGEALNAVGRDQRDWSVNVGTLKIESAHSRK